MTPPLETARSLLAKARDDLYVAQRLAEDTNAPTWPLGFHAQQAVEKALKTVLAIHGVAYPLTHNIAMLLAVLQQHDLGIPPDAGELHALSPFAVAFRYDDSSEAEHVDFDRSNTCERVCRTVDWAAACLTAAEDDRS